MNITALLCVLTAALLDIAANMMITKSQGFRRLNWGIAAILCVWAAFSLLGQAVKTVDLAVAYAIWGALGVFGTALGGYILFGHRLRPLGWVGIVLVTVAVIVLSIG